MGEKLNLFVYIREREFYFYSGPKKVSGVFESEQHIFDFLKENKVTQLVIIFSRPAIFIRTLEFPFSSLKKISQVIPEEAAPLFPVSSDELEFFWYPVSRERSKAVVTVIAIERSKVEKWRKHADTRKCRIKIIFEPFILSSFISRVTMRDSFSAVFVDDNYVSKTTVKDNKVIESYSLYTQADFQKEEFMTIINSGDRSLPVVCISEPGRFTENIQLFRIISVEKNEFPTIIFSLLESHPHIIQSTFKLYPVQQKRVSISPAVFAGVVLFFGICAMMFRPYFIAKQAQASLDELNKQMEQIFKQAFPEVTRVVNPLVQARERLKNTGELQQIIPKISIISIMRVISEIVPENIPFKVSQMSLRGSDLFLSCSTNTFENVDALFQIFTRSNIFQQIKVGGIMPEGDQISFTLLLKVVGNAKK